MTCFISRMRATVQYRVPTLARVHHFFFPSPFVFPIPLLSIVVHQKITDLEYTVLDIELGHAELVHERGNYSERRTSLRHDGYGYGRADTVLSFLNLFFKR